LGIKKKSKSTSYKVRSTCFETSGKLRGQPQAGLNLGIQPTILENTGEQLKKDWLVAEEKQHSSNMRQQSQAHQCHLRTSMSQLVAH
jgi:hypothetical protein